MPGPTLVPGDKVVHLAALLRSSALLTGAVASGVTLWVLKHSVLWVVGAVLLGAAAGLVLGSLLGFTFFPVRAGNVVIVKLGPGAFPVALKAGLIGATCTGILAGTFPAIWLDTSQAVLLAGTGLGIGVAIGSAASYVATRP